MDEIRTIPETQFEEDGALDDHLDSLEQEAHPLVVTSSTQVTHTVTFKCISAAKELQYQKTLATVSKQLREGIEMGCIILSLNL